MLDAEKALEIVNKDNWLKASRKFIHFLYEIGELSKDEKERWLTLLRRPQPKNFSKRVEIDWVETVKTLREILSKEPRENQILLLILYYSGVRVEEAVKLFNEYDPSNWYQVTSSYGRYWLGWIRGRKRCDWIYLPSTVKNMLEETRKHVNYNTFRSRFIHLYGFALSKMRKLLYQVCRQLMDKDICNFYESRIGELSVSELSYDNLLRRADRNYPLLLNTLQQALINPESIDTFSSQSTFLRETEVIP